MIRSWGKQTLTGAAQALFQDALTADFVNILNNQGTYALQVADSSRYEVDDRIILGVNSGSPTNCVLVNRIVDGTHVEVVSEGNAPLSAWPNGTKIALNIACYDIYIQPLDGNAASVWVGADYTVTSSGGGSAWYQLTKVAAGSQPNYLNIRKYTGANPLRTTEATMAGALNDTVLVGAIIN